MANEGLKRFSKICLALALVLAVAFLTLAILRLAGYVQTDAGKTLGGLAMGLMVLSTITSAMAKGGSQK